MTKAGKRMKAWVKKAWLKKVNIQIYLFVGCFLLNLIGILALNRLVLSDEIGTIANGAYFAGLDWSESFSTIGLNYYKYGQAILYILLFKIFNNPVVIYKMALVINALFISLIPCLVYSISCRFLKFKKRQAICVACIIGVLPSSMLWSKLVWAETLLFFIPWYVLYLLFDAGNYPAFSKKKKAISGILIGIIPLFAYMVHARGVVLPIAVLIVILYMKYLRKVSLVRPLYYIFGLVMGLGIDELCNDYLFKNLWLSRSTNNSVDSTIMYIKKYDLLSWTGLRTFINTIMGWLYSVIGSSYGLVTTGFVIAIVGIVFNLKKKKEANPCEDILYSFSVLTFMGSFALGILFFIAATYEIIELNTGKRFDKFIYCRYLASAFGPLILVVYYNILKKRSELFLKSRRIIFLATMVVLGLFLIYYSSYTKDTTVAVIQICTLPMFLTTSQGVVENFSNFELHMILCTIIMIIGFIFVMISLKKRKIYLMTGILSGAFIFTYLWSIFTCYKPINDIYNDEIEETQEVMRTISSLQNEYPYLGVCIERGMFSYQFAFPNYQIIGEQGKNNEYEDILIIDNNYEDGTYLLSTDYYNIENNSNVLIKGIKLNDKVNEFGIKTDKVTEINIFTSLALYNDVGKRIYPTLDLLSRYTYFSKSRILVTNGKYRFNILSTNISKDNLSFKIEGRDGRFELEEEHTSGMLSYIFEVKHTRDRLVFEIANISNEDMEIAVMNLEKLE